MNFIQACFSEYESALVELLEDAGFTREQASVFLPEAAQGLATAFQNRDIELIMSAFGSKDPSLLLSNVDTNAIADNTRLTPEQVTTGIKAIAPLISRAFKHSSEGMVGAAISIAWESKRNFKNITKKLFT